MRSSARIDAAKTLALLADEIFDRHADIVEEYRRVRRAAEAHLALVAPEADAGHLLRFDDEGADAVRARAVAGPRHDHDVVGGHAVAAPLLAAVEDVAIAVLLGAGVDRGDVGARLRLGNRDRRHDAALGDDRQVLLALFLGAEMKQRHDEHAVEAGDRGAGRRDLGDLLAGDADHGQVAVRAAILLGHP